MGLSDPVVVLLCICIAGIVVAAAGALHRVVASEEFQSHAVPISNAQDHYMRQVRSRNWTLVNDPEAALPDRRTEITYESSSRG
ncbi:uncharacterized protein Z518_01704 [Rhinocladiella mackenziei CBS 650.93]|uniref:Uncharacterized protein n=1 Tax=Rhinocladiella mackenziei CBS 650.93 TaxID=1442369 RepID=A0A0D2JME2_9EURO|nr:uncharacterized protein Z518_01704 [Rhinocladiella mackenziei CBS 650.93]KIX10620.1 hypothetical protein Z518_01704 [Rhinocladiella mackenziei CBS 650.93]